MMSPASSENLVVLALVQAMVGAISPNFRRVSVGLEGREVRLQFVLERDSEEDRAEIDDIAFEFEALLGTAAEVAVEVIVTADDLLAVPSAGRVVFARREP